MGRNNVRHIISGLDATLEYVYPATPHDVWIDAEDTAEALSQIRKLTGDETYRPEVYPSSDNERVCLRLQ